VAKAHETRRSAERLAAPLSGGAVVYREQGGRPFIGAERGAARNDSAAMHWETILSDLVRAGDIAIVCGISIGVVHVYVARASEDINEEYYWVTVLSALVISRILHFSGAYELSKLSDVQYQTSCFLAALSVSLAVFLACAFLARLSVEFSRVWLIGWSTGSVAAFLASRMVLRWAISSLLAQGLLRKNIVIVGAGEHGRRLVRQIMADPHFPESRLVGFFDDRASRIPDTVDGIPVMGTVGQLIDYARHNRVDQVIVALPWSAEERLADIIESLKVLPIDIHLSGCLSALRLGNFRISSIGCIPLIEAASRPISGWKFVFKELEDKILASILTVAFLPVILGIAIAIKATSRGPVLFKQLRYGFNNRLITVYKFRTMHEALADPFADKLVTKNDPRVTPIGSWLRRTSLDELPQLLNVLTGEMSLVGPRPHALNAKAANCPYEQAVRDYAARHRVKPGMTGWAQINGWRGETDTIDKIRQRVRYDLYYIENWTLVLDLKILVLTPIALFSREGAY
jgi:Undecaprenyl-phosphate glucose phosphotransferase